MAPGDSVLRFVRNMTREVLSFAFLVGFVAAGVALALSVRDGGHDASPRGLDPAQKHSFPRRIPSERGKDLTLERPASRAVALSLAAEEMILDLGGPLRLAAVTPFALDPRFSNVAEPAAAVGEVVSSSTIERIIALEPDIVFVATYTEASTYEVLSRSGIAVVCLPEFRSLEAVRAAVQRIGHALGLDEEANDLARQMDARIEAASKRAERALARSGREPARVLYIDVPGGRLGGAWTAGSETIIDELLKNCGARNVAAEAGVRHEQGISAEAVIRWQPRWILTPGEPSRRREFLHGLQADPVLGSLEAVREGRVIMVPSRHLLSTSHHVARAAEDIAGALYPRETDGQ